MQAVKNFMELTRREPCLNKVTRMGCPWCSVMMKCILPKACDANGVFMTRSDPRFWCGELFVIVRDSGTDEQ